ncbi:kelch domain-containing protein 7B [Balaenoptera musculus]|uniref:Kelch domain containing 7B n=1 Tax=Balaenoptera musculus TaxID=9771 RepID=A0A8C0CQE2_BALMU|nr:kelch domain-containing protein 7B [Balaenoptera musculus]
MTQGVLEADGPGWGWDGDGDEDWDGAVLTLLALAVVAATALALHWFGSGQDQEAAGPASTAPRPSQVGGPGPALPPKSKVSGGVEGHSSGQGKPYPPGRGQGSPAAAGAQDQEPPRGGGLAATATPPLKTPGEVASGGALGQQRGNATPEAPRGKGREPRRPGAALLGQSKAEGTSVPLLIHFTPRSPGGEVEVQVEAGGVQAKAPAHQALVHMVERDTSPWQQGVASPGSLGRGPGSRRWQVDRSSGERTCRSPRLDPLSLGTVVSVWDSVGAASSLPAGSQGLPFPQELPPSYTLKTRPPMDVSERGRGKSSPQPAPVLALDSGAKATESREAGTLAPRESQRSPASMEGWPWVRREVLVTGSFSQAPGSMGLSQEGPQGGHPHLSQGEGTTEASTAGESGANGSGDHPFFSSGPGGTKEQGGHSVREGRGSLQGQVAGGSDRGKRAAEVRSCMPSLSPSLTSSPRTPNPLPPTARPHPGLLPVAPTLLTSSLSVSLPPRVGQGPAEDENLKAVPSPAPGPSPVTAAAPGPASGSRLASQKPSVVLCKGSQEGQFSTSWGNLISMVLRSHPFPRAERPQGRVPRAALESPRDPSTSTPSENRESGSSPEEAVPSHEDRRGSAGLVTGGLAEAGAPPQQSSTETNEAPTAGPPSGPRGERIEEKPPDSLPPGAAEPRAPSWPPEQTQPGPAPSPVTRRDSQPVPRPRKRSLCEISQSSEREASPAAPGQRRGQEPGEGPSPAGSGQVLTEKQKEARKLMVFLQRPGGWGVVEGPQKPRSLAAAALQRWLDLGSCLEALAFAQQHRDPGLAQETYAWMSDNLLHVLGDPSLYRQLSGADRERILSLRTSRGQAVLGVLVLPSLYRVSRSGLTRDPRGVEAPAVRPAPPPPRTYLHVFHPRENAWRPLTQVPQEAPLRGCGLCTLHNYLFLAGGIRGSGAEAVCSNEVFCYNPLTNIWSQVRPMQQARAQLKLVALDGLLYAIGGECLYSMERYDPRTDAWTSRAPLPAGTFPVAHEAVACRGDIYVTGGHLFYRLLRYSPAKDAWDECPYSASHRRSSDIVALGGFLYRFDLLRGVGAAVMRYNTVTSSWSRAASLPLPDPAPLRCAVLGNTIYCLNHQVTATFTVSEGTAQFQAKELQPFPPGAKGVLCPFILTLPTVDPLQTAL